MVESEDLLDVINQARLSVDRSEFEIVQHEAHPEQRKTIQIGPARPKRKEEVISKPIGKVNSSSHFLHFNFNS